MRARYAHITAACVATCTAACFVPASACPVVRGQPIVLASQTMDPDVFLWDSGDRLIKYAQGEYSVGTVLKHTTLIRAYSRGVVVACHDAAVRPTFAGSIGETADLVGVRVTSGSSRGRYGWVLSIDLRRPDGSTLAGKRHM